MTIDNESGHEAESAEGVAEAEHEVVLFLEVQELVADVKEEGIGKAHLKVGELIRGTCLFRTNDIVTDT